MTALFSASLWRRLAGGLLASFALLAACGSDEADDGADAPFGSYCCDGRTKSPDECLCLGTYSKQDCSGEEGRWVPGDACQGTRVGVPSTKHPGCADGENPNGLCNYRPGCEEGDTTPPCGTPTDTPAMVSCPESVSPGEGCLKRQAVNGVTLYCCPG
jgi:hypothetical protein